jgi:hypothetical protein
VTGAGVIDAFVALKAKDDSDAYFRPGGTYLTDQDLAEKQYCKPTDGMFNGFSSIDLQTELNDDDGTLTGLSNDAPPMGTGTISVNQDQFFAAPVETAECLSNYAIRPPTGCSDNKTPISVYTETQTARTSPFDYVYVAIAPSKLDESSWSKKCSNESCYGVPLYRQYLTETEHTRWIKSMPDAKSCEADPAQVKCRWPFIRMSGMNINQRGTLTVNHGKYYIDTSPSKSAQTAQDFTVNEESPSFNVFEGEQTYNVFFVYAKQTTQQTYQIYVGNGFNKDDHKTLRAIRVGIVDEPIRNFSVYRERGVENPRPDWLTVGPYEKGILTITIDFKDLDELKPAAANLCRPSSFCKPTNGSCGCALSHIGFPLSGFYSDMKKQCDHVCSTWAVKDLDCPPDGCLGFAFTLPQGFTADDSGQKLRPPPEAFPKTGSTGGGKPDWTTRFKPTANGPDSKSGGTCYYNAMPGPDCKPAR